MRFLTRTFRNVFYVRVGKRYVRMWRLANSRLRRLVVRCKLEDARNCRRWRRSHAHCCHWHRGHAPPVRKPNPNLNQRPLLALSCLKLDNSSCYALYSCGNNCNNVVKLVQEYNCFYTFYFCSAETVHREHVS